MKKVHFNTVTCKLELIKAVFKKYVGVDKRLINAEDLLYLEAIFKEEFNLNINFRRIKRLSPMELIVVVLAEFENSYKLRADYLCVKDSVVKEYEKRAKKKLGVKSKNAVIEKLCELGIIFLCG